MFLTSLIRTSSPSPHLPSLIALDCVQTPPTLTKKSEFFLRGGGVCTQAIIELVLINMNSPSHNSLNYMHLLSSISAWVYLYTLGFTYMHLPHPYALPSPLCTFLRLCTPDFKRRLSFSLIRTFIHLYTLGLFISVHFSLLFSTFRQLYTRLSSLICACFHLCAVFRPCFLWFSYSGRPHTPEALLY